MGRFGPRQCVAPDSIRHTPNLAQLVAVNA
jgi:hypothetical protein